MGKLILPKIDNSVDTGGVPIDLRDVIRQAELKEKMERRRRVISDILGTPDKKHITKTVRTLELTLVTVAVGAGEGVEERHGFLLP